MLNEPDGVGNDFDNDSAISTSLKPQAKNKGFLTSYSLGN